MGLWGFWGKKVYLGSDIVKKMGNQDKKVIGREGRDGEFLVGLRASYFSGICFGLIGRALGGDWEMGVPLVPVAVYAVGDAERMINCGTGRGEEREKFSRKKALCYLAYGAGVATAHADRIFQTVESLANKF
jgi:hypothetical protein